MITFKNKRKAFTLIELLIVIAIIGILFIVLVSKVDFATDKAKISGVQTDFRSFQVAFESVAKEHSGFATLGWDTGDIKIADFNAKYPGYSYVNELKDAGDRVRNSYDVGDKNFNGEVDEGETWTGRKVYTETWTEIYSLDHPLNAADKSGYLALEEAINKNLDPKLHITINPDTKEITMANQAQDPWKTEYHGFYLTNATVDKMDRGAIIMYSDGANKTFGCEQYITGGVVGINIPGGNIQGKDDLAIATTYTFLNGYGEVLTQTSGFGNNQGNIVVENGGAITQPGGSPGGNNPGGGSTPEPPAPVVNTSIGFYYNKPYSMMAPAGSTINPGDISGIHCIFKQDNTCQVFVSISGIANNSAVPMSGLENVSISWEGISETQIRIKLDSTETLDLNFDKTNQEFSLQDDPTEKISLLGKEYKDIYVNTTYYTYQPSEICDIILDSTGNVKDLNGNIIIASSNLTIKDHVFFMTGSSEPVGFISMNGKEIYMLQSSGDPILVLSTTNPSSYNPYHDMTAGLYKSNGTFVSWDSLLAAGYVHVDPDGTFYTLYKEDGIMLGEEHPYSDYFTGTLIMPSDGSIKRIAGITGPENDKLLTKIGFSGFKNLNKIVLPQNIQSITSGAFVGYLVDYSVGPYGSGCTVEFPLSLKSIEGMSFTISFVTKVILPDSCTTIGEAAFLGCSEIEYMYIPKNTTTIERTALAPLPKTLEIHPDNARYAVISNGLVDKTTKTLIQGGEYTSIPSDGSVLYIGGDAFNDVYGPETLIIPSTIVRVENNAFSYCGTIKNVIFEGNTIIGTHLFYGCSSLQTVVLPNGLTTIPESMFEHASLVSIVIPNSVKRIENDAFASCSGLTNITIPDSVEYIGNHALDLYLDDYDDISYTFEGGTPPTLGTEVFVEDSYVDVKIYVDASYVDIYKTAWPEYADNIFAKP